MINIIKGGNLNGRTKGNNDERTNRRRIFG